jgi:hypothetical protein
VETDSKQKKTDEKPDLRKEFKNLDKKNPPTKSLIFLVNVSELQMEIQGVEKKSTGWPKV